MVVWLSLSSCCFVVGFYCGFLLEGEVVVGRVALFVVVNIGAYY